MDSVSKARCGRIHAYMLTGSLRKPYHLIGIDICNYPGGMTYAELGWTKTDQPPQSDMNQEIERLRIDSGSEEIDDESK